MLAQIAWRNDFLARPYGWRCMGSMLSPIDTRQLIASQTTATVRMLFFLGRAKTGRAAAGALSHVGAILLAYLKRFRGPPNLMEATPLFWTRGGGPVSSKGKSGNGRRSRRRARISSRGHIPRVR